MGFAGRKYRRAFELAEDAGRPNDSNRALQNWTQSIILRAGLASDPQVGDVLHTGRLRPAWN